METTNIKIFTSMKLFGEKIIKTQYNQRTLKLEIEIRLFAIPV